MCQVCTELGLEIGDVIEADVILDKTVAEFYPQLRSGFKGIVVNNDDYFKHLPSMQSGDPTHLCVVWEDNDPINVLVLAQKKISWRRKRRGLTPKMK